MSTSPAPQSPAGQSVSSLTGDPLADAIYQALLANLTLTDRLNAVTETAAARVVPHPPRVFRPGDPEPSEPVALLDRDGQAEVWDPAGEHSAYPWSRLLATYGPLVEVPNFPDYAAVVAADAKWRAEQ